MECIFQLISTLWHLRDTYISMAWSTLGLRNSSIHLHVAIVNCVHNRHLCLILSSYPLQLAPYTWVNVILDFISLPKHKCSENYCHSPGILVNVVVVIIICWKNFNLTFQTLFKWLLLFKLSCHLRTAMSSYNSLYRHCQSARNA